MDNGLPFCPLVPSNILTGDQTKRGNRMIAQFTLTVSEGKRIIAKAVAKMPPVKRALYGGRVLLKGGTTVSAVSEEIGGRRWVRPALRGD